MQPSKQRKRQTASPEVTYDIAVVSKLDRVTAPKQQRSEESLRRVLAALEQLLQTKPFTEISLPEIASAAGCSAATIYGRFKDKASILVALHESLSGRMLGDVDEALAGDRWRGKRLDALLRHVVDGLVPFYRQNRHLLSAVFVIGDAEVYQRAAKTVQHVSELLAIAVGTTVERPAGMDLAARVDLGVRALFALLQQRLLFGDVRLSVQNDGSDDALAAELVQLLRSCLSGGGIKSR